MEQSFWNQRWQAGQIAFHQAEVNPHLVAQAERLLPAPTRVLVPLCGKTHDLAWLASRGHEVWGVEFVELGARAFFEERGLSPQAITVGSMPALRHGAVTIVVGDMFAVEEATTGLFSAIYDRAALVAVDPARRREYVQTLRRLATPGARLLLISFDHDLGSGPPFSIPAPELAALTSELFTLDLLARADVLATEPRFRQRGATRMEEAVWLGQAR